MKKNMYEYVVESRNKLILRDDMSGIGTLLCNRLRNMAIVYSVYCFDFRLEGIPSGRQPESGRQVQGSFSPSQTLRGGGCCSM